VNKFIFFNIILNIIHTASEYTYVDHRHVGRSSVESDGKWKKDFAWKVAKDERKEWLWFLDDICVYTRQECGSTVLRDSKEPQWY
jgi:hypothetical protein